MEKINIILDVLTEPKTFADVSPVFLTDETIEMRKTNDTKDERRSD